MFIENGELCFESIDTDDRNIQGSQITGSSGEPKHLPTDSETIFTSWVHNFTDLTPWVMVGLFFTNDKIFSTRITQKVLSILLISPNLEMLHCT